MCVRCCVDVEHTAYWCACESSACLICARSSRRQADVYHQLHHIDRFCVERLGQIDRAGCEMSRYDMVSGKAGG